MLVEQLRNHLKELKTLEKASSMDEARSMLGKLLAAQENERKEIEEQMAEEARNLQHFQAIINVWSKLSSLLRLLLLRRKP